MIFEDLFLFAIPILLLFAAYVAFFILHNFLRRIFKNRYLVADIITNLKGPILCFLLEIALFISLDFLPLSDYWNDVLEHAVMIAFIATVGWGLTALTVTFERYLKNRKERENIDESEKRSFVTRIQIFYRSIVFLITVFTFASILMTFPMIKSFGIGILGSAGVAGIALGIAARPILLNLMSGFQIAFTKMLKIGDSIVIDGESGIVEQVFLTHVIVRTPDLRRILFPISFFIDKPFQNWSRISKELISTIYLYCDYNAPLSQIREQFKQILDKTPLWNGRVYSMDITNVSEQTIQIRFTMSAEGPGPSFELGCFVREEMIMFMQAQHPEAFPRQRLINTT